MKAKQFKKISAVFALSLTLAGTAASVCLPLLSVRAEDKNMIKSAQPKALTTEQQVLDAVKAAKAAGVTVDEKARATKTVASKDYDATKKVVSDGYAQQIKTLNERTTKQKAQDAKYQKELADWNAKYNNSNDASDVVDPNTLIQKLVLNAEPDAKMNVKNLNPDKATGRMLDKKVVDPGFQTVYGTGNNSTGHDDQVLGAYAMASKDTKSVDGNIGEVTYTNLKHSEYDGKKIVKIVITFSSLKSGLIHNEVNGGHPSVLAAADPTVTLSYFNSDGITYTPKYYTEDGKQVDFSQRHAYLSFGSLNSNGPGKTIEKAQVVDGGKAVGFSGSSVTAHKDGWLYSDKSNDYGYIPEEFKGWDDIKSPKAAYGAGLVDIKTNKLAINYTVNSKVYVWARASTTIPQSIVPPKPVKPTPLKPIISLPILK
ncbi:GbpC/Spa domain-containing protein [Latilactobacillus sakei]